MKKLSVIMAFIATICLCGCKGHQLSDLELGGDCNVLSLTMDNEYTAIVERNIHRVTVRLPKDAKSDVMTITAMSLSEGATANLHVGEDINLRSPRNLRITNGSAYQDWTLRAKNDAAVITSFRLNGRFSGIIKEEEHTIRVSVPKGTDITNMKVDIEASEYAVITPSINQPMNFSAPVTLTVDNNTAHSTYVVTVTVLDNPKALFVGTAESSDKLNLEEQAACNWMLANVDQSLYASWAEIKAGNINMSECKIIWWHLHKDGGVNNQGDFETEAAKALECRTIMQDFINGGGALLLTRYATFLPAYLSIGGVVATGSVPNNCWGGVEDNAERTGGPWSFFCWGHSDHPIYQNLKNNGNPEEVFTCDAGYYITNSTAQWHIWEGDKEHWGYESEAEFEEKTGAQILGQGGNKAIVVWEFPKNEFTGGVLCIGSGAYDWYSKGGEYTGFHQNVETMTLNAITYLTK